MNMYSYMYRCRYTGYRIVLGIEFQVDSIFLNTLNVPFDFFLFFFFLDNYFLLFFQNYSTKFSSSNLKMM